MTSTLDNQQSRQRMAEVRELWNDWDPIGVVRGADDVDDEYNSYLAPTLRLLERNAPIDEIVAYLNWVTLEHMGLSQVPRSAEQFAKQLQEWFSRKWAGTRVPGA